MVEPYSGHSLSRSVSSPEQITGTTLLGVCASLKPALGAEARSATRSLLNYSLEKVGAVYPDTYSLDLRDHPLPFFDGRMPREYQSAELEFVWSCVERAGALLFSIPAYWSGVSGVFKNFVDTLCGPAYDMEGVVETVFTNKPVGLLIVGADLPSTQAGAAHARQIMASTGAVIAAEPIAVANPRTGDLDAESLSRELVLLGAQLAQRAFRAERTEHE
jgi:NAD(P)H-dependent FMN reductase